MSAVTNVLYLCFAAWILFFLIEEGFALAQRTKGKLTAIISSCIIQQNGSSLNSALPACFLLSSHQRSLHSAFLPIVPSLIPRLNNPSVRLFSAFLPQDPPSEHGAQSPNQNDCGTWVRNINGGVFTSPNYPTTYPPNKECVYILEGKAASFLILGVCRVFL